MPRPERARTSVYRASNQVSGLSMPVGLSASADSAAWILKAVELAGEAHHFLGVSAEGVCGIVESSGNPDVVAMVTPTVVRY